MSNEIDPYEVIEILFAALTPFVAEDEGIVIDSEYGRFIIGKMNGELTINQCIMDDCDDEFKNVPSGSKVKLKGNIEFEKPSGLH